MNAFIFSVETLLITPLGRRRMGNSVRETRRLAVHSSLPLWGVRRRWRSPLDEARSLFAPSPDGQSPDKWPTEDEAFGENDSLWVVANYKKDEGESLDLPARRHGEAKGGEEEG